MKPLAQIFWSPSYPATALFMLILSTYLLTMRLNIVSDNYYPFLEAKSIVTEFNLSIDLPADGRSVTGREGRNYSRYPIARSLLFVIPCFLAHIVETVVPSLKDERSSLMHLAVSMQNALLAALAALFLFRLLGLFGIGDGKRILATCIYAFCSQAWFYSRYVFMESISALLFTALFYYLILYQRNNRTADAVKAVVSAILLVAIKEHFIVFTFAAGCGYYLINRKEEKPGKLFALLLAILPLIPLGLTMLVNFYKFSGSKPLGLQDQVVTAQLKRTFDLTNMIGGVFGLTFSPGKGVFWYNLALIPGWITVWRMAKTFRKEYIFICGIFLFAVLFFGSRNWSGGGNGAWGPRYMSAFLPILLVPFAVWLHDIDFSQVRTRLIATSAVIFSFCLTIPSILVPIHVWQKTLQNLGYLRRFDIDNSLYIPSLSALYNWPIFAIKSLGASFFGTDEQVAMVTFGQKIVMLDISEYNEIWIWWLQPGLAVKILGALFIIFWLTSMLYFILALKKVKIKELQ